jgi:UTP--glucose-1-phosphate uridylyltransferase
MQVRKAVIAAAGFGTRFLPQTKAMPKEMLPLIDKPIIQYVVEELVEAGIRDIIIVTGYSKRSIEDHFDAPNQDLINNLVAGGPKKAHLLDQLSEIANLANFIYVRQKGRYGNATPLTNVAHLIGDEPFIYTYADDLILTPVNRFKQMIDLHEELGGAVFPCIEAVTDKDFDRYGIMGGTNVREGVIKMDKIIEKPGRANAPSNLASVGGYLMTSDIFNYLDDASASLEEGQEFYVQPAMQKMLDDGRPMYACALKDSEYCDTGDKLDYMKTAVKFALKRDDIGEEFRAYLKETIQ